MSTDRTTSGNHWLARPGTVRILWIAFCVVLAVTVAVQFVVPVKGPFAVEQTFGFGAWFGFAACVSMVLVAKVLGWLLKRQEDYYRETDGEDGDEH